MIGFEDADPKAGDKPLITMSAPAYYKSKWCMSDDDKDGRTSDTALAAVGTKGASGAKNTDEVAVNQVPWWVFGGYTQPDKKSLVYDEKATPYTTKSGIKGSVARAHSKNTPQKGKCASDGKAITFGFKNSAGDFVAWTSTAPRASAGRSPRRRSCRSSARYACTGTRPARKAETGRSRSGPRPFWAGRRSAHLQPTPGLTRCRTPPAAARVTAPRPRRARVAPPR